MTSSRSNILRTAAALLTLALAPMALQAETILNTQFNTSGNLEGWRNDYFATNNLNMTVANGNLTVTGGTGYRSIYHTFSGSSIPTGKVVLGVGEQIKLSMNLRWNATPTSLLQFGFIGYDGATASPNGINNSTGYFSTVGIPTAADTALVIRRANGTGTSTVITLDAPSPAFTTVRDEWYQVSFSISRIDTNVFQLQSVFGDHIVSSTITSTEAAPFLNEFASLYLGSGHDQPARFSIDGVTVTYGQIPEASSVALLAGASALAVVAAVRMRRRK